MVTSNLQLRMNNFLDSSKGVFLSKLFTLHGVLSPYGFSFLKLKKIPRRKEGHDHKEK